MPKGQVIAALAMALMATASSGNATERARPAPMADVADSLLWMEMRICWYLMTSTY